MRTITAITSIGIVLLALVLQPAGVNAQDYTFASRQKTNVSGGNSLKKMAVPQEDSKKSLHEVLKELNGKKGFYFLISDPSIQHRLVNPVSDYKKSIEKILDKVLDKSDLAYK